MSISSIRSRFHLDFESKFLQYKRYTYIKFTYSGSYFEMFLSCSLLTALTSLSVADSVKSGPMKNWLNLQKKKVCYYGGQSARQVVPLQHTLNKDRSTCRELLPAYPAKYRRSSWYDLILPSLQIVNKIGHRLVPTVCRKLLKKKIRHKKTLVSLQGKMPSYTYIIMFVCKSVLSSIYLRLSLLRTLVSIYFLEFARRKMSNLCCSN